MIIHLDLNAYLLFEVESNKYTNIDTIFRMILIWGTKLCGFKAKAKMLIINRFHLERSSSIRIVFQ